jgi:exonuclease III
MTININSLKVSFKYGMIAFEKTFTIIKSATSHDIALVNDIKIPAPIPALQVTRTIGNKYLKVKPK